MDKINRIQNPTQNPRDSLPRRGRSSRCAAPTLRYGPVESWCLRYGPAGDSAPRLRLKASGMAERLPFGPSTARSLTTRPIQEEKHDGTRQWKQ